MSSIEIEEVSFFLISCGVSIKVSKMWLLKIAVLSVYLSIICANPTGNVKSEFLEQKVGMENNFVGLDEPLSYRLPNTSIPLRYSISIITNVHENDFNFTGEVSIHIKVLIRTNTITLHYRQIQITKVDIFLPDTNSPYIADPFFLPVDTHDFLHISVDQPFEINDEYVIRIRYQGYLREDSAGFYRGSYVDSEGVTKYYAATQFLINDARHAFPCYDEPGIRAEMQLSILHGSSYQALSNTEVMDRTNLQGTNLTFTRFVSTPSMQASIMGFIIFDYDHLYIENSRVPQRIFATPSEIQQGKASFAGSIVGDILQKLESIFDTPYPLNKMDHVALSFVGMFAMENFGLIKYHTSGILLDQDLPWIVRRRAEENIVSLIAHEFAHQWFGNTVSPKWWSYNWLSIGFAKFFELYVLNLFHPQQSRLDRDFIEIRSSAFHSDQSESLALNAYVDHPDLLWWKFDGISSNKAACVLRMMMEALGEDVFFKGLNIYLKNNYMKSATPDDLHAALQEAFDEKYPESSMKISDLMYTWEELPGYPLISVRVSGNNLIFSQRRYPLSNGELYLVPMTLATKSDPDFTRGSPKMYLDAENMTVSQESLGFAPNDWMIVNNNQVGYYRVDYDSSLWHAIINQLNQDHEVITPINRASLLYEFFLGMAELERVNGGNALEILSYFDKETESIVWNKAQQTFIYLNNLFGTAVYEKYLEFLQKITSSHLDLIGYDDVEGEDIEITRLRAYTRQLNCQGLDNDCLSKDLVSLILYRMNVGNSDFDFCNAMRHIDNVTFSQILNDVITNKNLNSRFEYMRTLGCTLDEINLKALFSVILDPENNLNDYERETLLIGVTYTSNIGLEMSINFIDENYLALLNM